MLPKIPNLPPFEEYDSFNEYEVDEYEVDEYEEVDEGDGFDKGNSQGELDYDEEEY